jgi:energy-coupling factor transporter ATP-binding protein EcfA2
VLETTRPLLLGEPSSRPLHDIAFPLASHRPLLVSGPSGCGKSSLASDIKRVLGWEYERQTIYSRMQAHDLLYDVDYVKRLQDAHADRLGPGFRHLYPARSALACFRSNCRDAQERSISIRVASIQKTKHKCPSRNRIPLVVNNIYILCSLLDAALSFSWPAQPGWTSQEHGIMF